MRMLELASEISQPYRHGSATPSPEAFVHSLWANVLTNFAILRSTSFELIGNCACYGADFRNQTAHISVFLSSEHRKTAAAAEAAPIFIDYLFEKFAFRKLYAEVLSTSLPQFSRVMGGLFVEEARYVEDVQLGEAFQDKHVFALWKSTWVERIHGGSRRGLQLGRRLKGENDGR